MTIAFAGDAALNARLARAAIDSGTPVVIEAEGGLWDGRTALPGASRLLARFPDRYGIVSNDARHTIEQYVARLAACCIRVPPERVLTAGTAVIAAAALRFAGRKVLLLAPRGLVALARSLGIELAETGAAAVVIADDLDLSWQRLDAASVALAAGAPCLAASNDAAAADGSPAAGTLVAALAALVPQARIEVLGLPAATLLRHAVARAGASGGVSGGVSGGGEAVLIAAQSRATAAAGAGLRLLTPQSVTADQ